MSQKLHGDQLSKLLVTKQRPVPRESAADMYARNAKPMSGAEVTEAYGLLVHYTRWSVLSLIANSEEIGIRGASSGTGTSGGVWLSPSVYPACMVPYNLGLESPRDVCVVLDVSRVSELWGPGTIPPSMKHHSIWQGGGVEFYCPEPIPFSAPTLVDVVGVEPCGGGHVV